MSAAQQTLNVVGDDTEMQLSREDVLVANEMIANAIYNRFEWLSSLANPNRDIGKECGYPVKLDAASYRELYDRDALSARVVQVLPKESWQVQPMIYEDEDSETETEFETAWKELHKNLRGRSWYQDEEGSPLWDYLLRADILSGIGHYGVILLGLDDGQELYTPAPGFEDIDSVPMGTEGMYGTIPGQSETQGYDEFTRKQIAREGPPAFTATPVVQPGGKKSDGREVKTKHQLTFLKVFDETLAQITRYERDPSNSRFGLPQMYLLTFNDPRQDTSGGAGLPVASTHVHWSRVIHVADSLGSNDVLGYPRMKQVYNRLWDAYKVYGASGEGFWQMCFSMLSLETHPQMGGDVKIEKDSIREQLGKIRNRLQRHLVTSGMTAKTLPPSVSDPTPFLNVFIECVCIFLGCPVRVFKGSERGELASSQDDSSWNDRLRHRQLFYITPKIIVPFIDRLIKIGVLPEPEGYSVTWSDLESLSDKDKAAIAYQLTQAMALYISGQCENMMTPLDFFVNICKIPHELAESCLEAARKAVESEEQTTIKTPEQIAEEQATMQGGDPSADPNDEFGDDTDPGADPAGEDEGMALDG